MKWPTPKNTTELRGFLGVCACVRMFINNYARICRPLNDLLCKDAEWVWQSHHDDAMNRLKTLVTNAPCLIPIDYNSDREVVLAVDSSFLGVGFVLFQLDERKHRRPSRYGALSFNEREQRYSQAKIELFGLYRAVKKWMLYLKGMLNSPDQVPSATLNRWIEGILVLPFTLRHVPGKRHLAADGLSRRGRTDDDSSDGDTDDSERETIANRPKLRVEEGADLQFEGAFAYEIDDDDDSETTIQEPQKRTKWSKWLATEEASDFTATRAFRYFLQRGRLYRRRENGLHQLVVKKEDRGVVLAACHDKLGHKGVEATGRMVAHRFWWKGVDTDVDVWVKSCLACQKRSEKKPQLPIVPSRPTQVFRHVYIDCMIMPKSHGKTQIVAARDDLTGYIEARMISTAKARTVAAFIWEDIICRWGAIEVITTDNGTEFVGAAVKELVEKYGIHQITISPYNSRASGVVERGHRTFREALVRSCDNPLEWPRMFHHTLWAERVTIRAATGYSPFYLVMGYQPFLPIDAAQLTFAWDAKAMPHEDLVAERARLLARKEKDVKRAEERIAQSRWKSAARWNLEHKATLDDSEHAPGTLVLIRNSAIEKELNRKHKARWLGPMVVVKRTTGGAYICSELSGAISRLRFAAFRVKKFVSRDGLTFDLPSWLGQKQLDSVENELMAEEDEALAWSLPNGDENSDEEAAQVPDGEDTAREEEQASQRARHLQVGPQMKFAGVSLPRVPNLPRFKTTDFAVPFDAAVATTGTWNSSHRGIRGPAF